MKRKISILFAICLLCALASGCSGEKSVSKVELPAVVPESPVQESVTPESTAQDLPEQNNSAPSQADVELDVPDAPEGKTTLVLGGIGLRDDTLASLVNNFNAENTKYTVVIDDYAEIHSRGSRQRLSCKQSCLPVMLRISTISETICFLRFRGSPPDFYMIWIH